MPSLLAQFKEHQIEKQKLTEIVDLLETAINEKPIANILRNALQLQHTGYIQYNNHLVTLEPQKSAQFSSIDSFLFRIRDNNDNTVFKAYFTLDDSFKVELATFKAQTLSEAPLDYLKAVIGLDDPFTTDQLEYFNY